MAKVVREGARERFLLAPDAEDDSAAAVTARAQRVPSVRGAPSAMSAWPRSLGCMPVSMAPPMPVLAGIPGRPFISPGRSPGFAAAPAGASPSNAVHQSDRQLDGCALPEKVEENLHPPAPGAGPLHDRDQPREQAAPDLHPFPRPEGRERPDDAALARARRDERDHAVLHRGGSRAEGDEAAPAGRPAHVVVLLEERDVNRSEERRVGKECRSRWTPKH